MTQQNLDDVKMLHHAGMLEEAQRGYLALLDANPHDVEVLHLLGLLCAEQGRRDEAVKFMKKALTYAPQHTALRLHLANIMKSAGNYDAAIHELQTVIETDPNCAPAFNNLGTIYYAQKKDDLAAEAYQAAIDLRPDYADAYYNLGLSATRLNRDDEAIAAYRALIALVREHSGAHFQLGRLLMKRRQFKEAAVEFQRVIDAHPEHFESLANLAVCALQQGQVDQSVRLYLRALDVMPADKDILFNLGVLYMQQGYARDAVKFYLRAIQADPDLYEAHHNLGAYYLMARDQEHALLHYREAVRIRPDDESSQHMIRVLTKDPDLAGSAPAYIQSLFDSYAEYYDAHMSTHLQYQVPDKLFEIVKDNDILSSADLSILDIGCGTGLCGALFKPRASHLTGIDLSEKMLEIAAQKNIYDELVATDIVPYLDAHKNEYDLAIAGDVLVYFGNLDELIAGVTHALTAGGYFAFNVETGASGDYTLMPSGRFCHHKSYLEKLARQHGFKVIAMHPVSLRKQESGRAAGYVCLWEKQS